MILEQRNDEISKKIVKEVKDLFNTEEIIEFEDDYEDYENYEDDYINGLYQLQNNFRIFLLKDKDHIKNIKNLEKYIKK